MSHKRFIITLQLIFFSTIAFCQYTNVINSNRPGESMSAFSLGKTVFQTELGISKFQEKHNSLFYNINGYNTDLAIRYGLIASQFEFITNINYQLDTYQFGNNEIDRSGLRRVVVGFKCLIYDPYKKFNKPNLYSYKANHSFQWRNLIPAVSLYAGSNFNFSDSQFSTTPEPLFDPKLMLVTQNVFEGSHVFVTNFYYDKISSENPTLGYVLTYTKGFNDHWSAFLENKGFKSNEYSDGIGTLGVAYLLNKNIQFDVSASKSFKNTPSLIYGGIGFSWRFDGNYKPDKVKMVKNKKARKDKKIKQIQSIPGAIAPSAPTTPKVP
jgi:Putative MetA-pathway of phenol degradation